MSEEHELITKVKCAKSKGHEAQAWEEIDRYLKALEEIIEIHGVADEKYMRRFLKVDKIIFNLKRFNKTRRK